MLTWAILIIFVILYLVNINKRHSKFPPGLPSLPIWGSYWFLLKEDYNFAYRAVDKLAKKYQTGLLGAYLGTKPCVFVTSYEMCKEVLNRQEFNGRLDGFIFQSRSFGNTRGVFFKDGPFWKEQRRFSLRYLRDYGFGRRFASSEEVFENEVMETVNLCHKNGKILMPNLFFAPTMNSMLYILIGRKFEKRQMDLLTECLLRFFESFDGTGNAISITPWLKHFAPKFFRVEELCEEHRQLYNFFFDELMERKASSTDYCNSDFMDVYLNKIKIDERNQVSNSTFTERQMMWVLIDFLFPVSVSIPFVVSYVLMYLFKHPSVQEKIHQEIDDVVGRNRPPNLSDRAKMPYTEAVCRETLRKHPLLVISTARRCTIDTYINGYFIPKDTALFPCQWSANHDPTIWDEPEAFKPERFLDQDGNLLKKDCSFVFGGGKRVCPGETFSRQLCFLFLTGLLQSFCFKPASKIPDVNDVKGGFIVFMPEFWVEPVRR